ncbi:MAG: peptide deformylase [Bacteroidetes bacterium]|nr:peptide deformylase [Bacteroidota bacterium]MCL2302787.1 peptide deformylase [Lentimicrobiaceae bacterium]
MLTIHLHGHPVLRKKANEVSTEEPHLQELIDEMFETMYNAEGVGLAAPQIGQSLQLFVIDTHAFKESYPDTEEIKEVFINPEVIEELGYDFTFNEGCLSLPEVREDIVRKSEIILTYINREGERKTTHFKGLVARVILHELDHLEGHVFTDRVSSIRKMIIKKKLNDIASGKTKPKYKSKHN